jgi:hypothetical protein
MSTPDLPTNNADGGERVTGFSAFADCAVRLVQASRMSVCALTQTLDARLYGGEAFADAVRRFVLQHERARVRILVQQPEVAVRSANHLIETARRLSSRIQFRQPGEDHRLLASEYWIGDERRVLHRERPEHLDAYWFEDAPLQARLRLRSFEEIWEHAVPARELGELRL